MIPFYLYQTNSAIQTIYTKDKLGSAKCMIEGLVLYYTPTDKKEPYEFTARVKLGNVEEAEFAKGDPTPIAAEQLTQVFEGKVVVKSA